MPQYTNFIRFCKLGCSVQKSRPTHRLPLLFLKHATTDLIPNPDEPEPNKVNGQVQIETCTMTEQFRRSQKLDVSERPSSPLTDKAFGPSPKFSLQKNTECCP